MGKTIKLVVVRGAKLIEYKLQVPHRGQIEPRKSAGEIRDRIAEDLETDDPGGTLGLPPGGVRGGEEPMSTSEAVRASLEDRVARGLTPVEAAGEERWSGRHLQQRGVLSQATVAERDQVISGWLRDQLRSPDQLGAALQEADQFRAFLDSYIDVADPAATLRANDAYLAWRTR